MKHLTINVDGLQIFDGEVAEFTWTDNSQQVTVTGRYKSAPGLLAQLQQLRGTGPVAPDSVIDGGVTDSD
jgi:hypothetical protein